MRNVNLQGPRGNSQGGLLQANQKMDLAGRSSYSWDYYESSDVSNGQLKPRAEYTKSFPMNQIRGKERTGNTVSFEGSSSIDPTTYNKYSLNFSNNQDADAFMRR